MVGMLLEAVISVTRQTPPTAFTLKVRNSSGKISIEKSASISPASVIFEED